MFSSKGVPLLLSVYQVYHNPCIPWTIMPHLYKSHQPAVTFAWECLLTLPVSVCCLQALEEVWIETRIGQFHFYLCLPGLLFFLARIQLFLGKKKNASASTHIKFLCPFSHQLSLLFRLFCLFPGCQNLFSKDCLILCKGCVELEVKKSKHRETKQEIANTKRTMYAFWG